ncbi:MAG TPA: HNH endonuclease signature motif containing protein [Caulobacteraceae bacterium]|nr:HNH endonuclease signature motif containing protein [Caulobacteraceae bacterium]
MIRVEWVTGESKGYTDLLPDYILNDVRQEVLVHNVMGPMGGSYQAKCVVACRDTLVDLDYAAFPQFNDDRGMLLGVMRLSLDSDGSPYEVLWLEQGESSFEGGDARVRFERGVDLARYDIRAIERQRGRTSTEKAQLIAARLGQGQFRQGLSTRWNGSCALTGLQHDALLRASHMKPWSESSDAERLDPANGLLLAAHVDALFDRHLITFDVNGTLHWDGAVARQDRKALALPEQLRLPLNDREKGFLKHHSEAFGL